jgi:hypothetical protein
MEVQVYSIFMIYFIEKLRTTIRIINLNKINFELGC